MVKVPAWDAYGYEKSRVLIWQSQDLLVRLPRFHRKGFLQRFGWTRALFFFQEVPTFFWDGTVRLAPRRIQRLFALWRESAELRLESDLVFQSYRGGDVVDIGAADGWYSCLLAPRNPARVFSFEPDPPYYQKCQQNLSFLQTIFPQTVFTVLPIACGNGTPLSFTYQFGHLSLKTPETKESGASLPSLPLDRITELFGLQPGFMKIDVEGFENEVLQGARETIARFRPVLMLELHKFAQDFATTRSTTEAWLKSLGYRQNTFYESDLMVRCLFTSPMP